MPAQQPGALPYETIANALFENYECIFNVDLETGEYLVYYESDSYRELHLERSGTDFFAALEREVERVVDSEDRKFVLQMLSRDALDAGIRSEKYHSLVYRILQDGRQVYHQLRASLERLDGRDYALMGVRNVDSVLRQNAEREDTLASEREKSANYLHAILATATAYTEANLTTDAVLTHSAGPSGDPGSPLAAVPAVDDMPCYSDFQTWVADNLVCDHAGKYLHVSSREHLLDCFERGTARASVLFSLSSPGCDPVPCRAVFYLYSEQATNDVHVLCVVYDLTDEQRREKEVEDLKLQLDLSRIRSSTSQMKPHFLYNALGSIQEVILEDPVRAADLLESFTVYLRGCVKAIDSDEPIPFAQEVENIEAYTQIERMRLGSRLEIAYQLEDTDFDILPLSIQPLVENAIRHGIHPLGKKGGRVLLRTFSNESAWNIQVLDSGEGFDVVDYASKIDSEGTESTGLKNIKFRLEKIMGATVDVTSVEGAGTCVSVSIPKEEGSHEGDYR